MASFYRMAILNRQGDIVAEWRPGLDLEQEVIDRLCDRVAARGIGVGRTTAHVLLDIREAARDLLRELKGQI